ncbi:hypothetical protein SNEBB_005275 [Seison nebaliae]|nr:hypothetical protein SNEBB_005275 [Seison nebaliae]
MVVGKMKNDECRFDSLLYLGSSLIEEALNEDLATVYVKLIRTVSFRQDYHDFILKSSKTTKSPKSPLLSSISTRFSLTSLPELPKERTSLIDGPFDASIIIPNNSGNGSIKILKKVSDNKEENEEGNKKGRSKMRIGTKERKTRRQTISDCSEMMEVEEKNDEKCLGKSEENLDNTKSSERNVKELSLEKVDEEKMEEIYASYELGNVYLSIIGNEGSEEELCFAFVALNGDETSKYVDVRQTIRNKSTNHSFAVEPKFVIHVFQCAIPGVPSVILKSFRRSWQPSTAAEASQHISKLDELERIGSNRSGDELFNSLSSIPSSTGNDSKVLPSSTKDASLSSNGDGSLLLTSTTTTVSEKTKMKVTSDNKIDVDLEDNDIFFSSHTVEAKLEIFESTPGTVGRMDFDEQQIDETEWILCPIQDQFFKLRTNCDKRFRITFRSSSASLGIPRKSVVQPTDQSQEDKEIEKQEQLPLNIRLIRDGERSKINEVSQSTSVVLQRRRQTIKWIDSLEAFIENASTQFVSHTRSPLTFVKCLGLLFAPGRMVKSSDMILLEGRMQPADAQPRTAQSKFVVEGFWDMTKVHFDILRLDNTKEHRVFFTLVCNLIVGMVVDPLVFNFEIKAKIFPMNEKFWLIPRQKSLTNHFVVYAMHMIEKTVGKYANIKTMMIDLINSVERQRINALAVNDIDSENITEVESMVLSGSGEVSKEVNDLDELKLWDQLMRLWRDNRKMINDEGKMEKLKESRPIQLKELIYHHGIPEALRGEVWQLLAGCVEQKEFEMFDQYKMLLSKSSTFDDIIRRDLYRTFPAHPYFSSSNDTDPNNNDLKNMNDHDNLLLNQSTTTSSTESLCSHLFRVCKAFSLYHAEVGYCQGLSFLTATLLLHLPEEQSFYLLSQLMTTYDLTKLFIADFSHLQMKFFQFKQLIKEHLLEIFDHFNDLQLEIHMFASQWFLTLYTSKFPLPLVYRILDLFFLDGGTVIFAVGLALLKRSKKDLLVLHFEEILRYFRVNLPRIYLNEKEIDKLMISIVEYLKKINLVKLKKLEDIYLKEMEEMNPRKKIESLCKELARNRLELDKRDTFVSNHLQQLYHKIDQYEEEKKQKNIQLNKLNWKLEELQQQLEDVQWNNNQKATELYLLKEQMRNEQLPANFNLISSNQRQRSRSQDTYISRSLLLSTIEMLKVKEIYHSTSLINGDHLNTSTNNNTNNNNNGGRPTRIGNIFQKAISRMRDMSTSHVNV